MTCFLIHCYKCPLIACLVILLLLVGTAVAKDASFYRSSYLNVHIPHALYKQGGFEHTHASFGIPSYGGSLAQNVYLADSDLCQLKYHEKNNQDWKYPFILLVESGNCGFATKARNAQLSSAAALVIVYPNDDNDDDDDDKDDDDDSNNTSCIQDSSSTSSACQTKTTATTKLPAIIPDDGSASDISIPTFLITKQDGENIKAVLQQKEEKKSAVWMQLAWNQPPNHLPSIVEYDLWTTPSLDFASNYKYFFIHFERVAERLGNRTTFTPHMYIQNGASLQCFGTNGNADTNTNPRCLDMCTNNGRYCATPGTMKDGSNISGAQVVTESLRRLCIWRIYGSSPSNKDSENSTTSSSLGSAWWYYMRYFLMHCITQEANFDNETCIQNAYDYASINSDAVDECMTITNSGDQDGTNIILESEIHAQAQRGIVRLPTATVNLMPMQEALTPSNVFRVICSQYVNHDADLPDVCKLCMRNGEIGSCADNKSKGKSNRGFTSALVIGSFVAGFVSHFL